MTPQSRSSRNLGVAQVMYEINYFIQSRLTSLHFFYQVVGFTTSGSYSYQLKKSMCFAYLPASLTQLGSRVEVEMLGSKFPAVVVHQPLFDPEPTRLKTV